MAGEEGLKVEGIEVGMVALVGKVESTDHAETKSTYHIEDDSGTIECVQWNDESTGGSRQDEGIVDGTYVRVVGSVRTQQEKKYVMVFKISPVSCDEEVDAHRLEILHSKLLIKKMNDKENAAIGANYGLSNSMVSGGGAPPAGNSASFGNAKYDTVYKMVAGCDREEGIFRDEVYQQLAGRLAKNDINEALEFLSNEGHIYTTTDDDHFKTTDS